jgi:hypothetical protein
MRSSLAIVAISVLLTAQATAKEVFLGVAGSVGVFRTDTRIFNPSATKDITVTAFFLPVGRDNSSTTIKQVTVPRRQMLVLNDVVTTLFGASGLGGIRLSTVGGEDFIATSRIYAQSSAGTLGQFVPGLDLGAAKSKGVLIQLAANGTTAGTYRTNLGFLNPNISAASVNVRKYDANNREILPATTISVPPYGVLFPVALDAASGNLSDGWVSYEASQPIFGFASVVDNGTTDPTYSFAFEDTGSPVVTPGVTKLYLSPLLDFKLRTTPTPVSGAALELCLSSASWTASLAGDMSGTAYKFNLGVQTATSAANAAGTLNVDIIHRRGSSDTVLASTTLNTTKTYEVKTVSVTGPDPATQAGDTIVLRARITSGIACIAEYVGAGTDHFIEIPQVTIAP